MSDSTFLSDSTFQLSYYKLSLCYTQLAIYLGFVVTPAVVTPVKKVQKLN